MYLYTYKVRKNKIQKKIERNEERRNDRKLEKKTKKEITVTHILYSEKSKWEIAPWYR